MQTIIGRKYCFDVLVIEDENEEPKEEVILHLYSNDNAIYFYSSTTKFIIIDSNGMLPPYLINRILIYSKDYSKTFQLLVIAF